MAATLIFVALLWKELKIVSFDADLALALGMRSGLIHYLLMGMVAVVTVAAFEAVGSILVVAMLIVPGATAHMLTDRLDRMLVLAVGVGVLSAILGYAGAIYLDTTVAGMMAVAAGGQFAAGRAVGPSSRAAEQGGQQFRPVAADRVGRPAGDALPGGRVVGPIDRAGPAFLAAMCGGLGGRTGGVVGGAGSLAARAGSRCARAGSRTDRSWAGECPFTGPIASTMGSVFGRVFRLAARPSACPGGTCRALHRTAIAGEPGGGGAGLGRRSTRTGDSTAGE